MRRKLLLALLALTVIGSFAGLLFSRSVAAQSFNPTVPANTIINSSVYATGKSIYIGGTVNGDVYCFGQNITINGQVNGDVLCAAQDITINGHVNGNARLAGQTVNVSGQISGNVTVAGGQVMFAQSSKVGSDLTAFGSNLDMNGSVGRDAVIAGSIMNIRGNIGRNVTASSSDFSVLGQAKIGGALTYTSKNGAHVDSSAQIVGATTHKLPSQHKHSFAVSRYVRITLIISTILFALLLVVLFPQLLHQLARQTNQRFWVTLLTGFIAALVLPVLLILLIVSLIGLPVALVIGLAWALLALASGPVAAYYLGSRIFANGKNAVVIMLIGALLLEAIYLIPIVGVIASVLAYMLGLGAELLALKRHYHSPNYEVK
jgi:cytoskeletal protein CcmA (bactofilin family)